MADIPGLSSVGGDVKGGMLVFLFTAVCTLQRAVSVTSQGPINICSMNECAKISIKGIWIFIWDLQILKSWQLVKNFKLCEGQIKHDFLIAGFTNLWPLMFKYISCHVLLLALILLPLLKPWLYTRTRWGRKAL